MRILIVSPFPVDPPFHGGRVRTLGLARGLARAGAEVAILSPWVPGAGWRTRLEDRLERHSHVLSANLLPALLGARIAPSLALLSLQPTTSLGLRRWLGRFSDADVVQFEFCSSAAWMKLVPPETAVVYSAHNVERDFAQQEARNAIFGRWARRRIENLERAAVRGSRVVIVCSDPDRRRLADLYGGLERAVVAPNGFDAGWLDFQREERREEARGALGLRAGERAILLLGGDAAHNREALTFLETAVLPRLGPDVRLLVVGRSARGKPKDERIRHLGFVSDLRPIFAAADVSVNPVVFGSGSNLKLVESLAAGLPVITTPFGLRGQPVRDLPGLVVAPRESFAEVLAGPLPVRVDARERLAIASWDRIGADLLEVYDSIRESRRPSRSA